jgi:TatD DNase family protein
MSRSTASRANKRGEPPPSPEPLPGPALDSHTHLDIVLGERPAGDEHGEWASDDDVDAEIAAAVAVNVPRLV